MFLFHAAIIVLSLIGMYIAYINLISGDYLSAFFMITAPAVCLWGLSIIGDDNDVI